MPRRPSATRRWLTASTWPVGVALTAWDYMWRTTPLHRRERAVSSPADHLPPAPAPEVDLQELIGPEDGRGPLFHRRYRTRIRDSEVDPEELFERLARDLNRAAPTKLARFHRVLGDGETVSRGEEYVVRMPGPWDGPVRVLVRGRDWLRLGTLAGHLEAGQIEFRARRAGDGEVGFEIESWARSADRWSDLLYHRLRMAKEVQLHMWISFLEGVVELSGGRMTGGIEIDTWRYDGPLPEEPPRERPRRSETSTDGLPPRLRARLEDLALRPVNYDADDLDLRNPPTGWRVDDRCQPLTPEPPGEPLPEGSFEIAARLIRGYEFADPSIVRAHYDPQAPLEGRNMLLELRALGLVSIHVGTRVVRVIDCERKADARPVRVFGWSYRTLEGHVERGEMSWEVWKWLDSGRVEFRLHAVSQTARIPNPFIRLGFRLLRDRERTLFLDSTQRRMRELTALAVERQHRGEELRRASAQLTARALSSDDPSHERLAGALQRDHPGIGGGPLR